MKSAYLSRSLLIVFLNENEMTRKIVFGAQKSHKTESEIETNLMWKTCQVIIYVYEPEVDSYLRADKLRRERPFPRTLQPSRYREEDEIMSVLKISLETVIIKRLLYTGTVKYEFSGKS